MPRASGVGIRWTSDTHQALLVAIIGSGFIPIFNNDKLKEVIAQWPADKGPPPSVSALSQHLHGLRRKMGASTGSAKTTPTSAKNITIRNGGSSARKSGSKHSLFNPAPETKRTKYHDSDDDEEEEGDTCASSADSVPPTSKTQNGRARASASESPLPDIDEVIFGTPSKTKPKTKDVKDFNFPYGTPAQKPSSALGKRGRDHVAHDEGEINDEPVPFDPYMSFMEQIRDEVKKEEVDGYGYVEVADLVDLEQASAKKKKTDMFSF